MVRSTVGGGGGGSDGLRCNGLPNVSSAGPFGRATIQAYATNGPPSTRQCFGRRCRCGIDSDESAAHIWPCAPTMPSMCFIISSLQSRYYNILHAAVSRVCEHVHVLEVGCMVMCICGRVCFREASRGLGCESPKDRTVSNKFVGGLVFEMIHTSVALIVRYANVQPNTMRTQP